jgi:hypothetical protein
VVVGGVAFEFGEHLLLEHLREQFVRDRAVLLKRRRRNDSP